MRRSVAVVIAILLLGGRSAPLAGQAVQRFAPSYSATLPGATARDTNVGRISQTHWVEGAILGAVVGGSALAYLAHGLCGLDETDRGCTWPTFAGAGLGALLGGTVGALVGGLFPKPDGG